MSGPDCIAVRAYTEAPRPPRSKRGRRNDTPSHWSLIFDCETTIDAAQRLRLGAYQVRKAGALVEEGLFFDADALDADELRVLTEYAREHDLICRSREAFVDCVLYGIGYDRRGAVIGFNLPFDISRIAIGHGPARGSMRGGFSFQLSASRRRARLRVKHLNRRAALIDFARPPVQETPGASRRRGVKTATHRGFFIDVSTLAAALMSEGFTLSRLCARLGVATAKAESGGHGGPLTPRYLGYARTDVQATWECYAALASQYATHALSTPLHRIISEASIGKANLTEMGVASLLHCQPDFPRDLFGKIMCGYSGGRAEVHWRRTVRQVLYCDFKSMYPTVNALMGLWRFVIGDGMSWRDATEDARRLLDEASADLFRTPESWRRLTIIMRVRPDGDLFPVRAKYGEGFYTMGLNQLSYAGDLWMTLADCVAAKLLSGKAPQIEEAIAFEPGPPQAGLRPIDLFGNPAYRVDPVKDDVFVRLVDLRDAAKANADPLQHAIKIIANATSYGVFIEVIRDDAPKPAPILVCGPHGPPRQARSEAIEQPGRYFHPLLGVLITGAARLMLALAERQVIDAGVDWAFCDTDSIAIVKPERMDQSAFRSSVQAVVDWFAPLNPYRKAGSILRIEDANFALGDDGATTNDMAPLYCFAISTKRYALFNLDADGGPVIRKASAHGLGHLLAPYTASDAPDHVPAPRASLAEIGVERWQHDLWFTILRAALAGTPDQVRLDFHPALLNPAASRFRLSSPQLERWMRTWNATRDYAERARPFGFLLTFQACVAPLTEADATPPRRGRPKKAPTPKPVAAFSRSAEKAAARAFDRIAGVGIFATQLKSYAEALAQYHLHPEDKFLDGDYLDRGRTRRRHVIARSVQLIGKETNKWEDAALLGDATARY